MSAPDRRALLDFDHGKLSIRRQCRLLGVTRSSVYRQRQPANDNDLTVMRRLDELFTTWPFLGSRRMAAMLRAEGRRINRKRVQRLMRQMGIAALGPKPRTTNPAARPQDLPVSAARCGDRSTEPGVGSGHNLPADWSRLSVSGGDHGLGKPRCAGMAAVEQHGCIVLCLGAGGSAGPLWQSGHLQTPTRAVNLPARRSPACCWRRGSRYRWMVVAATPT